MKQHIYDQMLDTMANRKSSAWAACSIKLDVWLTTRKCQKKILYVRCEYDHQRDDTQAKDKMVYVTMFSF